MYVHWYDDHRLTDEFLFCVTGAGRKGGKDEGDIYLIISAGRAGMLLLGESGGRSSASSIDATAHWADRLFRMTSAPMRFPPPAVIGASPL